MRKPVYTNNKVADQLEHLQSDACCQDSTIHVIAIPQIQRHLLVSVPEQASLSITR